MKSSLFTICFLLFLSALLIFKNVNGSLAEQSRLAKVNAHSTTAPPTAKNHTTLYQDLINAVQNNKVEKIEELVGKGADILESTDRDGSLLHVAAENGSVDVAGKLIDLGVPVDGIDGEGQTPIWIASSKGDIPMIELLYAKGANITSKSGGWWGRLLLHETALNGKDEGVKWFLGKGLGINTQDNGGWTPLHLASAEGHVSTVRLLLNRGANTSIRDNDGEIPMHESARKGHLEVVRALVNVSDANTQSVAGVTPMQAAASKGWKAVVQLLIKHGAKVNVQTRDGWTALHEAAYSGDLDTVILLLDQGAQVDAKDKDGWTPLFCAAEQGHTVVVQVLTDRGANIRLKAKNGATPLHEAASRGHFDTVRELVQRRAEVNAKTNDGKTPMRYASIWNHSAVVDFLRSKGGEMGG